MADEPNKPDAGDTLKIRGSVDSETAKIQRDKLTLKKLDPSAAAASAQESEKTGSGDTRLSDPTRRRDTNTASLRRIRPKTSLGDTNAGEERKEDTETIHLKVIKEKKNINQLKNLLSASQTIRLRPSTGASAPAAPPSTISEEPVSSPPAAAGGADDQKRTLKIKAPSAAEAKTESIGRAPIRLTAAPGADQSKLSETGELNASMPASSKSTLKIKAPPAGGSTPTATPADAAEKKSRSTLKIKAPTASGTGPGAPTVKQPAAAASSDRTTKQEAPKASKTLKLKSTPRNDDDATSPGAPEAAAQTAQAAPQAQTMVGAPSVPPVQPQGGEPNIIDTLAALGAVAVGVAAAVVFGLMPFLNLYGG